MASGGNLKTPPLFIEGETDYLTWKKDVSLWQVFTDLPTAKVAIAIHLSLAGRARQATSEISVHELSDGGIDILIAKLDRLFLQDKNWRCFNAYLSFENYSRDHNTGIDEYLSEFDNRYYKLKECDATLPDAVVACRLLRSCNLTEVQFQLALSTTTEMTFENMRKTLKRLFSECDGKVSVANSAKMANSHGNIEVAASVKAEPSGEGEVYYGSNSRGRWYGNRGSSRSNRPPRGRRGNPVGTDGRPSQCYVCGSTAHFARFCSQRGRYGNDYNTNNNDFEEVQITLMASGDRFDEKVESLFGETIGCIILDSGCTKTVCGEGWLRDFLDTLTPVERARVQYEQSSAYFKFGDGVRLKSLKCAVLPCILAGKSVRIRTDVVQCSIPLLLSKSSMKRAGMVINLCDDTVTVFDRKVKCGETTLGHYTLPVFHPPSRERIEQVLTVADSEANSKAQKLHRQFAHPTADKLKQLLRNAGRTDSELLSSVDKVTQNCDTCRRYKRPRPRPVVAMPLASRFNDTVALDLKFWFQSYFLVMVDLRTRFCMATVVDNKLSRTIITAIFKCWVTVFGAPRRFLSDNGGEFNSSEMRCLGDRFGVELVCTAAESPWSNGVCERTNGVLAHSVRRVMDDTGCNVDIALSWAVSAKNALSNTHGFSPNQLVFGYNPVTPNVLDANPPMLENATTSHIVADNLNAMHRARQEFLRNESDEKVRRALLHRVRADDADQIVSGDSVYYKRDDDPRWRGPATVIGRDGKQILVRHGGQCVRVHACRLQHCSMADSASKAVDSSPTACSSRATAEPVTDDGTDSDDCAANTDLAQAEPTDGQVEPTDGHTNPHVSTAFTAKGAPKVGQRIECVNVDGAKNIYKVVSRAGKATGKYRLRYNVEKNNGDIEWVDLAQMTSWQPIHDDCEVLVAVNTDAVHKAKALELQAWKANNVFDEVEDDGQQTVSLRWVVTEKIKDNKPVVKARLVARGFEETLEQRTDSPTCSKDALRVGLTAIATAGWQCRSVDVKSAFLQGRAIDREVYVKPPPEFNNGCLWKLNKNVYGLNDAARAWYDKLKQVLLQAGLKVSSLDPALFFYVNKEKMEGIMCVHVDDILYAGSGHFINDVFKKICDEITFGSNDVTCFKYVGVNIVQRAHAIELDQLEYGQTLEPIAVSAERASRRQDDLGAHELQQYRGLVGQLSWMATQTRPDVSFEVCDLSTVCHTAKVDDALRANKLLRKVQQRPITLQFPKLDGLEECYIECYSDAAFGNLQGGGSQGGYAIFLADLTGKKCLLSWQSRKIRRVVKSTLAAETLALLDAAEAGVYLASLLGEILN